MNPDGYIVDDTRALGEPEEQAVHSVRQSSSNFVTSSLDPIGRQTVQTFDDGNLTSVTRLANTGTPLTFTYSCNSFGQVLTSTDPLNHTITFTYDDNGNLTSLKDPMNRATTLGYNMSGQVVSITDPLNHVTRFTYSSGDLVTITDPNRIRARLDH